MTTLLEPPSEITTGESDWSPDEAQLAAAAFLARYRGRTLEAYQYDLRSFFQWAKRPSPRGARRQPRPPRVVPHGDGTTRARRRHD